MAAFLDVLLRGIALSSQALAVGGPEGRLPGRLWAVGPALVGALLLFYREQ